MYNAHMAENESLQFFCPVCHDGFTEDDIARGIAIRRYDDCRRHFVEKFPSECTAHPGTLVSARCQYCGQHVCENCIIELAGRKVCQKCKPAIIGSLITGKPPAKPPRHIRRLWHPVRIGKGLLNLLARRRRKRLIREFYEAEGQAPGRKASPSPEETRMQLLFLLGFLSFIPVAGLVFGLFGAGYYWKLSADDRLRPGFRKYLGVLLPVGGLVFNLWFATFYMGHHLRRGA
jgi:hypothetical protein